MATTTKWFFNQSVDLDEWLSLISTDPREGQDHPAYANPMHAQSEYGVVCAFHPQYPPSPAHAALLAAAPALLERLKFMRDNFGVDLPLDLVNRWVDETDALIASVSPGWPKVR